MYTKLQTTYTSRAGSNTYMSLIGAVEIIQDSICEYFKSIDIDEITLKTKYNCIWVFTRNSVEFVDKLSWLDSFKVECFISSKTAVKLVVDTSFYKMDGTLALKSETEICLVDLSNFKIKRIDDSFVSENEVTERKFEMQFNRPIVEDNMAKIYSTTIPSTCIDYCGHVNNVEYLRFILNTYTAEELKRHIKRFDISYISQCLEGERIDIYKALTSDLFEIKVGDKAITRCKIVFE